MYVLININIFRYTNIKETINKEQIISVMEISTLFTFMSYLILMGNGLLVQDMNMCCASIRLSQYDNNKQWYMSI